MGEQYLTHTDKLVNHIYWFYEDLGLKPKREHRGLSINYTSIKERRTDFLNELVNTVVSWVYNKNKSKKLLDTRFAETGDIGNASSFLTNLAYKKFRPGHPQGQFGELLLFNLIQHYYKAVPILRKQRITTSTGHERFGADAIHYKNEDNKNIIFLGESKCYKSDYKFNKAFEISLTSIVNSFTKLDEELDLYLYDDFLEQDLQEIVKKYKEGVLENVQFELICLITYNETNKISGECEDSIKENIKNIIKDRCVNFDKSKFENIESGLLKRINYIIFPIWELDKLLADFQNKVGTNGTK
ncbi:DUF1837 domain-containing protein [Gelidibacter japonicus]|uniref:HamA C-terminal domain-containing protein n=1 Tax=Gelidibacter japonicus TaxID=1962232 RepID=UPI0020201E47|nr:DUF1837 domain-containing protein [Gelidibacter japonicus]MCL8008964.1 DUF1837 domain-containing protein [Gelidibacter japonicus]